MSKYILTPSCQNPLWECVLIFSLFMPNPTLRVGFATFKKNANFFFRFSFGAPFFFFLRFVWTMLASYTHNSHTRTMCARLLYPIRTQGTIPIHGQPTLRQPTLRVGLGMNRETPKPTLNRGKKKRKKLRKKNRNIVFKNAPKTKKWLKLFLYWNVVCWKICKIFWLIVRRNRFSWYVVDI